MSKDGTDTKNEELERFNHPDLTNLNSPMTNVLVRNGIQSDQVVKHVNGTRAKALKLSRWVCVRSFEWAVIWINQHPSYEGVIEKLKSDQSAKLLDLGCFISQETRQLIYDGVDPKQLAALDIEDKFFDLSYDFFNDRQTNTTRFYQADLLNMDTVSPDCLNAFDSIWACRFFHIWDLSSQIDAAINITKILRDEPGAVVFGQHLGNTHGVELSPGSRKMFAHSHSTWIDMWRQVARTTGTAWKVQTWHSELFDDTVTALHEGMYLMLYSVERIDGPPGRVKDMREANIELHGYPGGR